MDVYCCTVRAVPPPEMHQDRGGSVGGDEARLLTLSPPCVPRQILLAVPAGTASLSVSLRKGSDTTSRLSSVALSGCGVTCRAKSGPGQ